MSGFDAILEHIRESAAARGASRTIPYAETDAPRAAGSTRLRCLSKEDLR